MMEHNLVTITVGVVLLSTAIIHLAIGQTCQSLSRWAQNDLVLTVADKRQRPVLFFLFMGYDEIYNDVIWDRFFRNADITQYRILIHLANSEKAKISGFKKSGYCLIPTVPSGYCRISDLMNELLLQALKASYHPNDQFVFVSSDAIPVKPFTYIYNSLVSRHGEPPQSSNICLGWTSSWHPVEGNADRYIVKHHTWLSLNRADAYKAVGQYASQRPDINAIFLPEKYAPFCIEEHWLGTSVYGIFDRTAGNNSLVYPLDREQGRCLMYVYWDSYVKNSVFKKDIIDLGNGVSMEGKEAHHIKTAPLRFLKDMKNSSFMFLRKVRNELYHVHMADGAKVSWLDALDAVGMYD